MTVSFSLQMVAFAPHRETGVAVLSPGPTVHSTPLYAVVPGPIVAIVAYLATLSFLVIFGLCMGWAKPGRGGNGGGGTRRPRNWKPRPPSGLEPNPPGGRELSDDAPEAVAARDFAAWEAELQESSGEPARRGTWLAPVWL